MNSTHTFRVGDVVQLKPGVKVGAWLVGGFVCTVVEVINATRHTGLWLERRDDYDFPILVRADDVTFLRHSTDHEVTR